MPIRDLDFTIEGNPSRIARELEKGGAQIISENENLRHIEMTLAGDVDVSLAAAREDIYAHPGNKPEARFSTIMEDLRRRDFSVNAIAISLNANSAALARSHQRSRDLDGARFARFPFIALRISRSDCCAPCVTRPAWALNWIPVHRTGSIWLWIAVFTNRFLRKTRAVSSGRLA